jgi:hypothetical protein
LHDIPTHLGGTLNQFAVLHDKAVYKFYINKTTVRGFLNSGNFAIVVTAEGHIWSVLRDCKYVWTGSFEGVMRASTK